MKNQKLMLFSGFLGSGKTTTMVATAKYLKEKGLKVALITNDLGENLVDTQYANKNQVLVSEISNGCLCHDVPHFFQLMNEISEKESPDIIFAEPVGSCVDLVASVYSELHAHHAQEVSLLPFTCVIDPFRYASIYLNKNENTFNEEATYMYKKQLEDGDILLLNKCDLLSDIEKDMILNSLKKEFPYAQIVPISAIEGDNFGEWTNEFLHDQKPSLRKLDINWDYICSGDEHMGWYNNILALKSSSVCDFNKVTQYLISQIQKGFLKQNAEIAHLKIMCYTDKEFLKIALTSSHQEPFLSNCLTAPVSDVLCNINIRAILPPEQISAIIHDAVSKTLTTWQLTVSSHKEQSFDSFTPAPIPQ